MRFLNTPLGDDFATLGLGYLIIISLAAFAAFALKALARESMKFILQTEFDR